MASYIEDEDSSGAIISHAAAYRNAPEIELVAGCDVSARQCSRFRERWGVTALYSSVDKMVREQGLDIVSICSPADQHFQNAMQGITARAIFCEKPICDRLSDADQLVDSCAQAGVVLAVNHLRRWMPIYRSVREHITNGQVGAIKSVVVYYGGGIINIGTHLVDILRFLCGDVRSVRALPPFADDEADADLSGFLEFAGGYGCYLVASDVRDHLLFEIDIVGTEGRLRISRNGELVERWRTEASTRYSGYDELQQDPICESLETGQPMLAAVNQIAAILLQDADERPMCSGADGLAALEIACALRISAELSGSPIDLPVVDRTCELIARSRGLARNSKERKE